MSTRFPVDAVTAALDGRFSIRGVLRVGGQGVVFRATRTRTPDGHPVTEEVALKLHLDPQQDERVQREIRAMTGVRHPCLATLVEHGVATINGNQTRYAVWEFIDGTALDQRLNSGVPGPRVAACVGRDVASAVDHIWTKRIVHRDVSPKNIMLKTGDLGAVLIDLGAARHLDESTLTAAGITWGTYGYFSPEQARAEKALTCGSDVFSLGVVLLQCLSGRHPTNGDQAALVTAPPKTVAVCPSAPVALANLIDRMLMIRAAFRPMPAQLAGEFSALVGSL